MDLIFHILRGLFGILCLTGICWLLSRNRKAVDWKLVATGLILQIILALVILKVPYADKPVEWISGFFVTLLNFTDAGTQFVFGFLGAGPEFWEKVNNGIAAEGFAGFGLIFAFWDWLFGTLYVPQGYEKLEFGISREEPNPFGSVTEIYLKPFAMAWRLVYAHLIRVKI